MHEKSNSKRAEQMGQSYDDTAAAVEEEREDASREATR